MLIGTCPLVEKMMEAKDLTGSILYEVGRESNLVQVISKKHFIKLSLVDPTP